MKPVVALTFFVVTVCGQPVRAANPSDIGFQVRLLSETNFFHLGEGISFELSYTSDSDQKYMIAQSNPTPEFGAIHLRLEPQGGTLDPRSLRLCWGGIGGSHLSSGPRYLGREAVLEHADLTDWFRFQSPGHYSLTITSQEVSGPQSLAENGGHGQVTLESNTIEFDILPPDRVWDADQLRIISGDLENAKSPYEGAVVASRLALLDSPDSARKLVELYLSASFPERSLYQLGLTQSSQLDVTIPALQAALSDPETSPSGMPQLLAELQLRKERGVFRSFPNDPGSEQRWQAECQERRKIYDSFLARADALLLARISVHSGPQRGAAIYELWQNAENENGQKAEPPENLTRLRLAVLDVAEELTSDQQLQVARSQWDVAPRDQLLPLIRKVASRGSWDAYKLWCEGWPAECSAAILTNAVKPDTQMTPPEILQMVEAEHPELDSFFRAQLKDQAILESPVGGQRASALVLRAGSRELLPSVDDALTRLAENNRYNCEGEAYLLGYLLRFKSAEKDGQQRLGEMLQNEQCGAQFLRTLNTVRYSDALIAVALKALDSPNSDAAGTAALFLGDHGPAAVESALWRRLDALWLLWRDRAADLRTAVIPSDHSIQVKTANLEQSLASALSHANNWKLTPSERDRLHDSCITEQCRDIADAKMWRGL